jgi:hypothetical protein
VGLFEQSAAAARIKTFGKVFGLRSCCTCKLDKVHQFQPGIRITQSGIMILAIRGDKGIHFINGPPEYNQFDGFAPDAAKNCKVSFVLLL